MKRWLLIGLVALLGTVASVFLLAIGGAFRWVGGDPLDLSARVHAKIIAEAAKRYAVEHDGQFPATLKQLLIKDENGKGPYFEAKDAILDPWGKPFKYDPTGAINRAKGATFPVPDVYTTSPTTGRELGNWKENIQ